MKAKPVTGLISEGGIGHSLIPRLPILLASIGPVVARSFRVSRRIANSLRAGSAVSDLSALDRCDLIWIAVPDAALDRVMRDLASQTAIDRKKIVLCDSVRDSASASALHHAGARVASLNAMDPDAHTLVAEGNPAVLLDLRRLIAKEKRKLIEIRPASKVLYLTGSQLAGNLLLPWIAAAVESLRAAGFSRTEATRVVEMIGTGALHAYGKAGAKAWSRSAALDLRHTVTHDLSSLRSAYPHLTNLVAAGVEQALAYFEGKETGVRQKETGVRSRESE
jgi:predicted short-subunit dehydrogenase-like oxidoreductase (DUF2520 family)